MQKFICIVILESGMKKTLSRSMNFSSVFLNTVMLYPLPRHNHPYHFGGYTSPCFLSSYILINICIYYCGDFPNMLDYMEY